MDRCGFKRSLLAIALVASLGCFASTAQAIEGYELRYTGTESELLVPGGELFSSAEGGLPGDTFTGSLSIENGCDVPCEFYTVTRDVTSDGPEDTLERIAFTISRGDEALLFDDALGAAADAEPIAIGTVEPGEDVTLDYAVVIPPELTNEYADTAVGLNVAISAVKHDDGGGSDGAGGTGGEGAGSPGDGSAGPAGGADGGGAGGGTGLAQTGDTILRLFLTFAIAGAGTIGACALVMRKRSGFGR